VPIIGQCKYGAVGGFNGHLLPLIMVVEKAPPPPPPQKSSSYFVILHFMHWK
jgi:hypothetical protein